MTRPDRKSRAVIDVRGAGLRFGVRTLWSNLDLDVEPGEFVAVLGPNGSGKSSFLKVVLGQQPLSSGSVRLLGEQPNKTRSRVGYIPQQHEISDSAALRGVDLVGLGLDGHRWGVGLRGFRARREKVANAIAAVGAQDFAEASISRLSGGEQQRLRVAQALIGEPEVLLCDEPLLSLDLAHQRAVSELIDIRRRAAGTAVLFVTHEINPILSYVDRVLYLVNGRFRIGEPEEVMNSETLSELYRAPVEVLRIGGQIHIVGAHSGVCEDEPHHVHQ